LLAFVHDLEGWLWDGRCPRRGANHPVRQAGPAGDHRAVDRRRVLGDLCALRRADRDNSQDVLFSGQTSIPAVADATSTKVVVILLVAKFPAYGVSLGAAIAAARSSRRCSSASR
jgi:hypothetical protein